MAGARGHHVHTIGKKNALVDIVRDEQHRDAEALPHVGENLLHHNARLRIECAEGFVHQQHLRAGGERTHDADTLFHAARELFRIMVFKREQARESEQRACGLLAVTADHTLLLETELDVLAHRQPREQRVLLKHHAAIRARLVGDLAVDRERARAGRNEPGNHVEQGGFAAAGRADDGDKLARLHFHRDIADRLHRRTVAAETHSQVLDPNMSGTGTFI